MKMTKKSVLIATLMLVIAAIGILLIAPILNTSRIPTISDPQQLRDDTATMVQQWIEQNAENRRADGFVDEVPSNQWPDTVKSLQPIRVTVAKHGVTIVTSTGGIDSSFGIFVALTEPDEATLIRMKKSAHLRRLDERIYRWDEKE